MSFYDVLSGLDFDGIRRRIAGATARDVERALSREHPTPDDFPALFSAAAQPYLEQMAQRSAAITERRFGRVIQLYAPIYVSNECVNRCAYCGFAHDLAIPRVTLTPGQVVREARFLHQKGFRHLLLVSGESPKCVTLDYLREIVGRLNELFSAIAIEIQPMHTGQYRQLAEAGVDGLAIYQETYDPVLYRKVHLGGPKRNFRNRLEAIECGGEAGFRSLGIGALLGLGEWRLEAVMLAMHGRHLTRRFWKSRVAVSFPRINDTAGHYKPQALLTDADLIQMICAMRMILPDAEMVMSTRERAELRDNMIGLGITRTSAGSRTNPGGYEIADESGEQFEVSDPRSPEEVARAIEARGFEPVWKDFDRQFVVSRIA